MRFSKAKWIPQFLILTLLVGVLTVPASAAGKAGQPISAMTLNLYIGGDISRLTQPAPECDGIPDPPGPQACSVIVQAGTTLEEIQSTDFDSRAEVIARLFLAGN